MTASSRRTPASRSQASGDTSPRNSPSSRSGAAQRREQARAAAARLREEQERSARRARRVVIGVLVAAVLLLGAVVAGILTQGGGSPLDDVRAPRGATASGAIPVGASGVAGTADGAEDAVVVSVYADYLCPFCGRFEETNGAVLDELRESGEIVVEYHPVAILDRLSEGSEYSTRAATAAALVADRAPEAFVGFNHALYADQPEENTPGLDDAQLAETARSAGAGDDVVAAIADGSYRTGPESFAPWVAAATEQAGDDLDRLATPAILLDGEPLDTAEYDWTQPGRLAAAIDAARG